MCAVINLTLEPFSIHLESDILINVQHCLVLGLADAEQCTPYLVQSWKQIGWHSGSFLIPEQSIVQGRLVNNKKTMASESRNQYEMTLEKFDCFSH